MVPDLKSQCVNSWKSYQNKQKGHIWVSSNLRVVFYCASTFFEYSDSILQNYFNGAVRAVRGHAWFISAGMLNGKLKALSAIITPVSFGVWRSW
jgi:hypothetical protein